jgi:2-(1,2-epoxy-1,2-dihydrophenyl)acetyl-CoA isomerase
MLAEPVSAGQALAAGLLTAVVDDDVDGAAQALAARLAAGPTAAYAAIKTALGYAATHSLAQTLDNEARLQDELGRTADHQAATMAFLHKRQPSFEGH